MKVPRDARTVSAAFLTILFLIACAPGRADRAAEEPSAMKPENRAAAGEVLAARNTPITLKEERTTISMEVPPAMPESVGGEGERLGLYLEGLEMEKAGVYFDVYANLPAGAKPDPASPYYVGALSSFGPRGAKVGFDVTKLVEKLEAEGRWTEDLRLTFVRRGLEPAPGERLETVEGAPAVRIQRVRIVRE
jgi:tyrosinase